MPAVHAVDLAFTLDRSGGRRNPLGQQVVDELRRRVQGGTLGPGERLPPVRSLADRLDVTPETVDSGVKGLI
jgi:DNA-binding GntR family transcriptional regulator